MRNGLQKDNVWILGERLSNLGRLLSKVDKIFHQRTTVPNRPLSGNVEGMATDRPRHPMK